MLLGSSVRVTRGELADRDRVRPARPDGTQTASGDDRMSRGSRRTIGTSSRACSSCSRPAGWPAPASRTTPATAAAERPAAAAFSWSTSSRSFGCWRSTYQSTSTTPGVRLERRLHLLRRARRGGPRRGRRPRPPASAAPAARAAPRPPGCARRAALATGSSSQRALRFAIAWLCADRSSLGDEVHLEVGQVRRAPQEVVAHEAVEVVRRRGAGVASGRW